MSQIKAIASHLIREIKAKDKMYGKHPILYKGMPQHTVFQLGKREGLNHALITLSHEYPEIASLEGYVECVKLEG